MERGLPNKDQRGMIERGDNSIQSSLAFAQELDGFYQDQMQGMTDSYEIDALKKARDEAIDLPIRHARQVAEVSKNASIGGNFNPSNPLFDEIWTPTMQKLDEGEAQFGLTPVQEPIIQPEQPIEPTQPTEEPAPAETGAEMPATPPAGAETPAAAPTEQPAPPPMPLGPGAEPQIPDRLQPPGVGEGQLHNQWEIKSEGPSPEEMQAMMAAQGAPPAGAPPGMPPATAKSLHDELKNRA